MSLALIVMLAAGLVCVLYDHLLTFDDELEYIWSTSKNSSHFTRIVFVFVRYSNEIGLFVVNYGQ